MISLIIPKTIQNLSNPQIISRFSSTFSRIQSLFEDHGEVDYIGEAVSISEHGLQAADYARSNNMPKNVILAALFHDVGHLLGFCVFFNFLIHRFLRIGGWI